MALAKAAELASIDAYGVSQWPKQKTFFEILQEDLEGAASAPTVTLDVSGLPIVDDALRDLIVLEGVLADGAAAMLPSPIIIDADGPR